MMDLVEVVKSFTNCQGPSVTIDTTGNVSLIESCMEFTANRGQVIIVGIPPQDYNLKVHLTKFMTVRNKTREYY
jgi:Zn-dependent alcohol dehydrogenase